LEQLKADLHANSKFQKKKSPTNEIIEIESSSDSELSEEVPMAEKPKVVPATKAVNIVSKPKEVKFENRTILQMKFPRYSLKDIEAERDKVMTPTKVAMDLWKQNYLVSDSEFFEEPPTNDISDRHIAEYLPIRSS
jgi:hypothetical protein